jgi:2'-5' RNA ligase
VTGKHGGHTIGIVLAIPSPFQEQLDAARARYEPEAGEMPAHVTILAPIDVDADALPAVRTHLTEVAARTAPFRLTLAGTGTFLPVSPVVFVNVDEGAAQCSELESSVRSGDMAVETRYPYHPHVTLAHDVRDEVLVAAERELRDFTATIDVGSFGLYEHIDGEWTLVEDYHLAGEG